MARLLKIRRSTLVASAALPVLAALAVIAYAAAMPSQSAGEKGVVVEEKHLIRLPEARLKQIMANAEIADLQKLQQSYFTDGTPHIRIGNREYPLAPVPDKEYRPTPAQAAASQSLAGPLQRYKSYVSGGLAVTGQAATSAIAPPPPPAVDHRSKQTPVRNQGNRWTDISFASVAALEAAYGGGSLNLSKQYAHYLHMKRLARTCRFPMAASYWTHAAADALSAYGICSETKCPYYADMYSPPAYCNNSGEPGPAQRADAEAHSPYRIESFWKLWRNPDLESDTDFHINNPRCLEALLASGKDIVLETYIAGWTSPLTGVIRVQKYGNLLTGYHPMPPQGLAAS